MKGIFFSLILAGSLAAQAAPTFGNDMSPALKQQILDDINFVNSISGTNSSGLYKQIFANREINGADLMAFFEQRIHEFGLDSCGGGTGTMACVNPFFGANTMWITPGYINSNMPQIARIATIFHESRHTEARHAYWGHARCPVPFLDDNGKDIVGIISGNKMQGQMACDNSAFGAYAIEAVFLKNIEKNCVSCGDKMKMDAQLFGDDTIWRVSNLKARQQMRDDN